MTVPDLSFMAKLRQVLRLTARGRGVAAAIVETFQGSRVDGEREMVRRILMGHPVGDAMERLGSEGKGPDAYTRELALFVVEQASVDAAEASRRAERLSTLFEHWIWMKRQRGTDQKILETRSIMVSGILGGVTAMVSCLAPVLANFQINLESPPSTAPATFYSPYLGLLFVLPAASFLGFFFSRRRAYFNVTVAVAAYLAVIYFFGPLVTAV